MKLRIISTFLVVTAVSAWAAACGSAQGRPVCLVGHGPYAVKYNLKSGDPASACGARKGEVVGVQKYNRPSTPNDQTVAFKTATLTGLSAGADNGQADLAIISQGKLTGGDPDGDNFCTAPSLSTVHYVDDTSDISYAWNSVKFYVTPRIPGTQFTADLTYTENGCTANFTAVGVFPAVPCDVTENKVKHGDVTLCTESGDFGALNPDFPVVCQQFDADNFFCVLKADTIPSIAAGVDPAK